MIDSPRENTCDVMHGPLLQLLLFLTLHCTETCGWIAHFALSLTPFMDMLLLKELKGKV